MRGVCPHTEKRPPKTRTEIQKMRFLGYGPDGEIGYRLWDPEQRKIVRSSDVVFNDSAMHKTTERPFEV